MLFMILYGDGSAIGGGCEEAGAMDPAGAPGSQERVFFPFREDFGFFENILLRYGEFALM